MGELFRILKKEGKIVIIAGDGVLFNLYSENETLNTYLDIIKRKIGFDLFVGRKIPSLLKKAGAKNITYNIQSMYFNGDELLSEYNNYKQRFEQIGDYLVSILGSKDTSDDFMHLYLQEMMQEGNSIFYNKFIVQATK